MLVSSAPRSGNVLSSINAFEIVQIMKNSRNLNSRTGTRGNAQRNASVYRRIIVM